MSKEIFNLVPAIKAIEKELSKLADEYNRKFNLTLIVQKNLERLIRLANIAMELVMF